MGAIFGIGRNSALEVRATKVYVAKYTKPAIFISEDKNIIRGQEQ